MFFYICPNLEMRYRHSYCSGNCVKELLNGKLQCNCGEDFDYFSWNWFKEDNESNTVLSNNNRDILFHPIYSSGTAVLRGNVPFQQNFHYYWEIKMVSALYGTDVMVGIGTSKIRLSDWKYRFCSMLGIDAQSWGYSYHGSIQHNQLTRKYGSRYGLGSIVGVHLDMCTGTLEYYLNRKPLGTAFTGLKGNELYPMVSSTAAQSSVRIICALSLESTLQMKCLQFIVQSPELYAKYRSIPGLTRIYDRKYFWIVPVYETEEKRINEVEKEKTLQTAIKYKSFWRGMKNYDKVRWRPPEDSHDDDETISSIVYDFSNEDSMSSCSDQLSPDVDSSSTHSLEDSASTSKKYECVRQRKIRRTDSYISDSESPERSNKHFCAKCNFRSQIENDNLSDSSCSNCDVIL